MKPGFDVMVVSIDGEKAALEAIIRRLAWCQSNPRFGPLVFATMEKYFAGKIRIILEDRLFDVTNA